MYSFQFDRILELQDPEELKHGFYLWIWHADKIPPHIGCSIDGFYFSLKVNGKDEGLSTDSILKVLNSKRIPTLVIKIQKTINLSEVIRVFSCVKTAESNGSSCLSPLKEILNAPNSISQLSELLKYLQNKNAFNFVFGLNLKDDYKGIPVYGMEEIKDRLLKLENAKRSKNFPKVG
jgi:hypothetical protein